jgi:hypothetical protein
MGGRETCEGDVDATARQLRRRWLEREGCSDELQLLALADEARHYRDTTEIGPHLVHQLLGLSETEAHRVAVTLELRAMRWIAFKTELERVRLVRSRWEADQQPVNPPAHRTSDRLNDRDPWPAWPEIPDDG